MKLFADKFRRILEVFAWWGLWRKFWAHFHNLCVQKWSCFLRSSEACQKFSPCKVYNESSGCIITIFASMNEVVRREVQTDFGSFLCASFIQKFWAHYLDFLNEAVCCWVQTHFGSFRLYEESCWRIITIYVSVNKACLQWSSDAFWKFSAYVATSPVVLRWLCDSPRTGCAARITPSYV